MGRRLGCISAVGAGEAPLAPGTPSLVAAQQLSTTIVRRISSGGGGLDQCVVRPAPRASRRCRPRRLPAAALSDTRTHCTRKLSRVVLRYGVPALLISDASSSSPTMCMGPIRIADSDSATSASPLKSNDTTQLAPRPPLPRPPDTRTRGSR